MVTGKLLSSISIIVLLMLCSSCRSDSATLQSVQVYKHMNMQHRTGKHSTPDAIVFVPANFSLLRPVHLAIYNHGLMNNLNEAVDVWNLDAEMASAPANTVIIVPEWASNPEAYSSAAGPFHQNGFFKAMLHEIFAKTPPLKGLTISGVSDVAIMSYSGGFRAAATEIQRNGIENKITKLILFDSLYVSDFFDGWLQRNLRDLASGKKIYHNFYYDTARQSNEQLARLRGMLSRAGLSGALFVEDKPRQVLPAAVIARHPIIFKNTTLSPSPYTPHMSVPKVYFREALRALTIRERDRALATSVSGVQI